MVDEVERAMLAALDQFANYDHDLGPVDGAEAQEMLGELIKYLEQGTKLWCEGQRTG